MKLKKIKNRINNLGNKRYWFILLIIVILLILFSFISESFFDFDVFMNIIVQSGSLALAAIGMTFIILIGGIDLSMGSAVALSGFIAAMSMQVMGSEDLMIIGLIGVLSAIAICVIIGLINGFMIGYLKRGAFIVTLAMMFLIRGLATTISDADRVLINNTFFNSLQSIRIFNHIPIILFILLFAYFGGWVLLMHTTFGTKTYALGDNPIAAKAAGINIKLHTFLVYVVSGIFVGLASVMIASRAKSAHPTAGIELEFDVITAVVIGGVSFLGGIGNIGGTILGVTLVAVLFTGIGMLNISPFYTNIIKGILLIVAVSSHRFEYKHKRRKFGDNINIESKEVP